MSSEQLSKTEELFSAPRSHSGNVYSNHTTRETIPLSWVDDSSSNPSSDGPNVYRDTLSSILAPSVSKRPPRPSSKDIPPSHRTSRESTYETEASNVSVSKKTRSKKGTRGGSVERRVPPKKVVKRAMASSASNDNHDDSHEPASEGSRNKTSGRYAMMPCHRLHGERIVKAHAVQQAAKDLLADVVESNQTARLHSKTSFNKKSTTLMKAKLNKSR